MRACVRACVHVVLPLPRLVLCVSEDLRNSRGEQRKRSEGEKDAKIELAYAESRSLELIGEALKAEPGHPSQADYMMSQRYLETLGEMNVSDSEGKTIYLPYDLGSMSGSVATLPQAYGLRRRDGGSPARGGSKRAAGLSVLD